MRHTTGGGTALPAPPGRNERRQGSGGRDRDHGPRLPLGAVMSGEWRRRPRRPGPGAEAGARARVVIVGAGFGGLECARGLDGAAADVLLVDRGGYHLFTPLLYQVATALLNPSEIAYPLRAMFRKSPNVRVRAAAVTGVDFTRRVVRAAPGAEIPYDYLVLATGSANDYHGDRQLAANSIGLKTLEDGTRLRNHVLGCLERADSETDPGERRALLTFVVAGGGPGGVEYSGALTELLTLVAGRDYPTVGLADTRVLLVQSASRLLTAFPARLGHYAERTLARRGVDIRVKTHITAADGQQVSLSDGSVVSARTLVWAGGVAPLVPSAEPEPETVRGGRVRVDEFLRVPGARGAYALGDAAAAGQDGRQLPMVSAPAIQAGRYIAKAIRSDLRGDEAGPPFRYLDKGKMATIGRNAAVAQLRGGLQLTGFAGWLAWLSVHIWYLAGLRNRVLALASWAWYYLRLDRPIRIIVQTPPDPIVATLLDPVPGGKRPAAALTGDGGRAP
jgi:NADH dehydrogenase